MPQSLAKVIVHIVCSTKNREPWLNVPQLRNEHGIYSVSESKVNQVRRYIANQEEHHKGYSFQDEFRELCQRHGIDIDERYVWD